jgi:protocatechuate 4,5-dioxygenase alpha subunit
MDDVISGAYLFTGERSQRAYALNKMAMSFTTAENRVRFQADEEGYMAASGLSDVEKDLVRRRDWKGMMDHGASIYLVIKIGGVTGHPLPVIGNHTAGRG